VTAPEPALFPPPFYLISTNLPPVCKTVTSEAILIWKLKFFNAKAQSLKKLDLTQRLKDELKNLTQRHKDAKTRGKSKRRSSKGFKPRKIHIFFAFPLRLRVLAPLR